jgi:nucleoside recognition membrane protein YjiH
MAGKSKAVYIYPLQVWLTAICLGHLFLFLSTKHVNPLTLAYLNYRVLPEMLVLVLSVPFFLLLFAAVVVVDWHPSRVYAKKIIIALWCIGLVVVPMLLFLDGPEMIQQESVQTILWAYVGPLLAAVFFFRWPYARH